MPKKEPGLPCKVPVKVCDKCSPDRGNREDWQNEPDFLVNLILLGLVEVRCSHATSKVLQLWVAKVPWQDVAECAGIWTRISLSLNLLKMPYLVKMQNSPDFGSRQKFTRWKLLFVSAGISCKAFFLLIHFSFQIEHGGSRLVPVMLSPVPFGDQKPHQAGDLWVAGSRCFIFCYYISDDERRTTDFHDYESSRKTACG